MKKVWTWLALLSLNAAPAHAFVVISNAGNPAKWENNTVHYELFNLPKSFAEAIRESFRVWKEVEGVEIYFVENDESGEPGSRDGKNSISWVNEGWSSLSFNPPSNALAVTLSSFDSSSGNIIDADIYFNGQNFDWAVIEGDEDLDKVDVQNIATHEIGHMIGLDHSSVTYFESDPELYEATMFYASGAGETSRRVPQTDDERGIRSLYAASIPQAAEIQSVEEIEKFGNTRVYKVSGQNFSEQTSFLLTARNSAIYDVVARYKTIISTTEAEVELNISGFYVSEAELLAFNHPSEISSYPINIDSGQANANSATSGGGGGGCSLSADSQPAVDVFWIGLLACVALGMLRKRSRMRSS